MNREQYFNIPGLEQIYFEDSYVTDIIEEKEKFIFILDAVLKEHHFLYQPPKPGEQYCYRTAYLEFPALRQVVWLERNFIRYTDADGETDYGNIDIFYGEANTYHLEGDWGIVELSSGTPIIQFDA